MATITHEEIIQDLISIQDKFITHEKVRELFKFRQEVFDLFCLMDKEKHNRLYRKKGEIDEFWEVLKQVNNYNEKLLDHKDSVNSFILGKKLKLRVVDFHEV